MSEGMTPEQWKHNDDIPEELRELGVPPEELAGLDTLAVGGILEGRVGDRSWHLKKIADRSYEVATDIIVGNATDMPLEKYLEERAKRTEGMSDLERAELFWNERLNGETRIEKPQDPACEYAIVVPVYNERPDRILAQIDSLRQQHAIDPSMFEVIYVVNNSPDDGSARSAEVIQANKEVIEALQGVTDLNVFVIDKSTPGNEIERCNVGKARNRGVAEASRRFYENSKDGILIQTDADTRFEDPEYFQKLKGIMRRNPDAIGVAGGLVFEFDPDTTDPEKMAELRAKLDRFILIQKWQKLMEFLSGSRRSSLHKDNQFSGANMISRSYESAIIGGLIDGNSGEDPQFGKDLEEYGSDKGKPVIGSRDELLVVTALRESDRTNSSFKKDFDAIDIRIPEMVPDPFVAETLSAFSKILRAAARRTPLNHDEVRGFFEDSEGNLAVSEASFSELIEYAEANRYSEEDPFYREWTKTNFGPGVSLTKRLYELRHPQIPITPENYDRLVERVRAMPGGAAFVKKMHTFAENIRIAG